MRPISPRWTVVAVGAVAVLLITACGDRQQAQDRDGQQAQAGDGQQADDRQQADDGQQAQAGDTEPIYDCYGVSGTAEELTDGPPLSTVADHPGVERFTETSGGEPAEWVVLEASEDRLAAVRERDEPEQLGDQLRTHERHEVGLVEGDAMPDTDEDTWMVTSSGPCALEAQLGDLGSASLALAPDADPSADDRALHLHVTEAECASGETAEGRVEVVDLELTDDEVRLVVGVRPDPGAQTCPSNPPTPVTVELPEPLGDRAVVDASVLPQKELHPG